MDGIGCRIYWGLTCVLLALKGRHASWSACYKSLLFMMRHLRRCRRLIVWQRSSHTRHAEGAWGLSSTQLVAGALLGGHIKRLATRKLLLRSGSLGVEIIMCSTGGGICCWSLSTTDEMKREKDGKMPMKDYRVGKERTRLKGSFSFA